MSDPGTPSDPRASLTPGTVFEGRFEIAEPIGEGSCGKVYKAVQLSTGQLVALKILRHDDGPHERAATLRQRFHREMRLSGGLSHPNIVGLVDFGETADGRLFAAFQYVVGCTLQRVLEEEGSLDGAQAVHLMTQVLDALACAHRRDVVHRDLKPANIMVTQTGARRNALVLDFGLGGFAEGHRGWTDPRITRTGEMMGTPAYAAPEQLRGEPTTTRSDLYSWGLVLLECLTGQPVVRGSTVQHALHQQLGPEPIAIPDWIAELPVGAMLACVTAKDPDARSRSAVDIVAELDARPAAPGRAIAPRPAGDADVDDGTPHAQQRQVTALSCRLSANVVGDAALRIDALDQAMRNARGRCIEVVDRLGGLIVGTLGGTVQAAFGHPRPEEDAPRRAVLAALEILETVRRCSVETERRHIRLTVRVGVHTGLVVARRAAGGATASQIDGTTLDGASHLDAAAGPNEILLSAQTYELFRQLDAEPAPPVLLPGGSAPVPVHRLVGPQDAFRRGRFSATTTPFVGREDELSTLREAWEHAASGAPQGLLIVGDGGLGKSRLVHELRSELAGVTWLECRCTPDTQASPLRPFVDGLGDALGGRSLATFLADHALDAGLLASPLASLLALDAERGGSGVEPSPQERRKRTFDAMVALVFGLAQAGPTVLAIEDLHWADPTTLDLLSMLLSELEGASGEHDPTAPSLLVLLSTRSAQGLPRAVLDLPNLHLKPLSRTLVGEMITSMMPAGRALAPDVSDLVVRRAEGVPLFVEELVRIASDAAASGRASHPARALELPGSVRNLMTARLSTLSPAARHTAELAAAIGREFTRPVLGAIAAKAAADLDRDLEELAAAGLVHRRRWRDTERWSFKHALLRDAIYDCLAPDTCRRVHETIAGAFRDRFPDVETRQPETVALHYERAGHAESAIRYWRRAARTASSKSANAEAATHFAHAIDLVATLPDTSATRTQELELQLDHGYAVAAFEGFASERVAASFGRARVLGESVTDAVRQFWVANGLWSYHLVRGDRDLTWEYANRQAALAERTGDPVHELGALHVVGSTAFFAGEFARAAELLARSSALYAEQAARLAAGALIDPRVRSFSQTPLYHGWALLHAGDPAGARRVLEDAVEAARRGGSAYQLGEALNHQLAYWHDVGQPAEALPIAEECVAFCAEKGLDYWGIVANSVRGWALVHRGDVDAGRAALEQGLGAYRATGANTPYAYRVAYWAEARLALGQYDEGLRELEHTLEACANNIDRFYDAELHRLRGELLAGLGSRDAADEAFATAARLARDGGGRWTEQRTADSRARWRPPTT